jgi:amino acid transporter
MKVLTRLSLLLILLIMEGIHAAAQCAMCKATAESATENVDKGIGEGLNAGIVYLMLVPYVLLATVGLVFFRKKITAIFRA